MCPSWPTDQHTRHPLTAANVDKRGIYQPCDIDTPQLWGCFTLNERAAFLAEVHCKSQEDQPLRKSPQSSSAVPFPLALHPICWDVYFCYTLSRHVSFHSLVVSMTLGLQVVIILQMATGQETSVGEPMS